MRGRLERARQTWFELGVLRSGDTELRPSATRGPRFTWIFRQKNSVARFTPSRPSGAFDQDHRHLCGGARDLITRFAIGGIAEGLGFVRGDGCGDG